MTEQTLQDAILRHSLQILRLSAGEAGKVDTILVELTRELKLLLETGDLAEATKRDIEQIVKEADEAIRVGYLRANASTDTHALAVVVAEHTQRVLEDVIPANVRIPTDAVLMSLTDDVLIDGAPSSAWWNKQAEDLKFKFAAQVRQGIANNETQAQIVTRIVGKRGEPGIMDAPRRNARALVHSSVMTAAAQARLATFRKNSRIIAGVRKLSALDGHVCVRCAAYADETDGWNLDGEKRGKTTLPFPPDALHWNDRCIWTPIPKSFRDIGLNIDEPKDVGMRASSDGPVAGNTTFDTFLKRQSPEFIASTLGKQRAALFQAGKLTVRDLVGGTGRELTLEQLRNH